MAAGIGASWSRPPSRRRRQSRQDSRRRRAPMLRSVWGRRQRLMLISERSMFQNPDHGRQFQRRPRARIEPGPGPARTSTRRPRGRRGVEDIDDLRNEGDAGKRWISVPSRPSGGRRRPSAHRDRGCRRRPRRNRMWRAMSAPRLQRVSISSRAISPPLPMLTIERNRSASPAFMPVWPRTKRRTWQAADELEVPLYGDIVG